MAEGVGMGMVDKQPDFLTRHFGAVTTTLVALGGLVFGGWQFTQQDARAERDSRLALSGFVIANYDKLFDEADPLRRARMRAVMETSFPPELIVRFEEAQRSQVEALLPEQQTAADLRRVVDGLADIPMPSAVVEVDAGAGDEAAIVVMAPREAPALPATAFVHIGDEAGREAGRAMQAALEAAGMRAPGVELIDASPSSGDVRYFHHEDLVRAEQALGLLRAALPASARVVAAPVYLGDRYAKVPRGVIEVWLPPLGS